MSHRELWLAISHSWNIRHPSSAWPARGRERKMATPSCCRVIMTALPAMKIGLWMTIPTSNRPIALTVSNPKWMWWEFRCWEAGHDDLTSNCVTRQLALTLTVTVKMLHSKQMRNTPLRLKARIMTFLFKVNMSLCYWCFRHICLIFSPCLL